MKKATSKKKNNTALSKDQIIKVTSSIPPPAFRLYPFILILLVGSLCYSNTLHGPFIFDDYINIVKFEGIHLQNVSFAGLVKLVQNILGTEGHSVRPVASITFAINYYFGKLNTFGYHLVNLIIHLLSAILVYSFCKLTLNLPSLQERYGKQALDVGLLSGLLFVAHPIQTQAVSYIVQRMTSMAAMFYLLSLWAYAKGRRAGDRKRVIFSVVSVLSALLAFTTKEHTVTLPVIIILYEFFFFRDLDFKWLKKRLGFLFALLMAPLVVMVLFNQNFTMILKEYNRFGFTIGEQVLTELRVVVYYISLLLLPLPSRMNFDYDYSISRSLFRPPTTFISLLIIIGLVVVAFKTAKRNPLFSFGIFWFLITLFPESSILPIEIIYEHRLYLPSIGFFLPVAILLVEGIERLKSHPQVKFRLKAGTMLVLIIPLSIMTYQRNKLWQDDIALWEDIVRKSPNKARTHKNLGMVYLAHDRHAQAIAEFLVEIKLNPNSDEGYYCLGNAYWEKKQLAEAITYFKRALVINPDNIEAHNGLGCVYSSLEQYTEAEKEFFEVIRLDPKHPGVQYNLALTYSKQKLYKKAIKRYYQALEMNSQDYKIRYDLGQIYSEQNLYSKAITEFKKALKLNPTDTNIYNALSLVYVEKKMYKEAEEALLKSIAINGNLAITRKYLGNIYYLLKKNDKAVNEWRAALTLDPQDGNLKRTLEVVQRQMKNVSSGAQITDGIP